MRKQRTLLAVALLCAPALTSCTTIPSTRELSELDEARVAMAISCEMRDAWIQKINEQLTREWKSPRAEELTRAYFVHLQPVIGPQEAREVVVARLESEAFANFLKKDYQAFDDSEIETFVKRYSGLAITLRFKFDITQTDSTGSSLDLLSVVSRGTVTSGLSSSYDNKREALSNFANLHTLADLLTNRPLIRWCNNHQPNGRPPNDGYPIAGNLGLKASVDKFVLQNQSGGLIGQLGDSDLVKDNSKAPAPTMSTTVTFTTTIKAGLNPKVELTPQLRGTSVRDASVNLSRERVDLNALDIVFQLPANKSGTDAERRSEAEAQLDASGRRETAASRNARALDAAQALRQIDQNATNSQLRQIFLNQ